jgi:hypothetical protein
MGQFYTGTPAEFLDNAMFKLPYEMMANVVKEKDEAIQKDIDIPLAIRDKLKAQALQVDQPALKQKILDYSNRIDEIVAGIKNNVMDYGKFSDDTNQLQRDVTEDWTRGDIYNMESNRESYLENLKALREAEKKDPDKYKAGQAEALAKQLLSNYKGFKDSETGEYNPYQAGSLYGTDPLTDHVDKAMKGTVGEFEEVETDNETGNWRVKQHGKWQGWRPKEQLKPIWDSYVESNPNIGLALNQQEQLGLTNRKDEEEGAFKYLFNKYGRRKVLDSHSTTLSEAGKQRLAQSIEQEKEPDPVVIEDKVIVTSTTNNHASMFKTLQSANMGIAALAEELKNNEKIDPKTPGYESILKGDPTAIRAYFSDPATAEAYIKKFDNFYVKKNLAKGAIASVNAARKAKGLDELPTNPSKWSTKQVEDYNKHQADNGVDLVMEGTGIFKFPDGTNKATQKEYQKVVASKVYEGQLTYTPTNPIPSIKYGGAMVKPYDSSNPAQKAIVKGDYSVTYKGNTHWFKGVPTNLASVTMPIKNNKGEEVYTRVPIDKIGKRNIVVYSPTPGGQITNTWLIDNGHWESVSDAKGAFFYGLDTAGQRVKIEPVPESFVPSTVKGQDGKFKGKGTIKLGDRGEGMTIEYDVNKVATQNMIRDMERNEEVANLDLQTMKAGFLNSNIQEFKYNVQGVGVRNVRIENGKYYIQDNNRWEEITDRNLQPQLKQAALKRRE